MGLRLTTKVQVSGWRFLLRRLEHAIVRRDTRMFDDPLQFSAARSLLASSSRS
ncbi:ESX-1 secretion system protein EccB1 [Mycobacterium tuberculosis]|nr:ESX-1 secretion system protein EccB1 [Mycobacterium tuberculosis]